MSKKLKRVDRFLVKDKITGRLNGSQSYLLLLAGRKKPASKEDLIRSFVSSETGRRAFENYKTTRFYKAGDKIEDFAARRSAKLLSWGISEGYILRDSSGYSLSLRGEAIIALALNG